MKKLLIIREPETVTECDAMFDLRWKVLRKPWNQPKGSEKDDLEDITTHIIALREKKVVGTARLQKNSLEVGQIRYMAVDPEYQRTGIKANNFDFAPTGKTITGPKNSVRCARTEYRILY